MSYQKTLTLTLVGWSMETLTQVLNGMPKMIGIPEVGYIHEGETSPKNCPPAPQDFHLSPMYEGLTDEDVWFFAVKDGYSVPNSREYFRHANRYDTAWEAVPREHYKFWNENSGAWE